MDCSESEEEALQPEEEGLPDASFFRGPSGFCPAPPFPRVRNPHGRGTCTLRCLAFLPDHTQVPGTLELPESGASSPDHPP